MHTGDCIKVFSRFIAYVCVRFLGVGVLLCLCVLMLSVTVPAVRAQAFGSERSEDSIHSADVSSGKFLSTALNPIRWFQKFVSGADGDRCPMYPSCSHYAEQAVRKHGAFMGWIMSCDRLMRCGRDEIKRSPTVYVHGKPLCYDPVERNDFWWERVDDRHDGP